MSTEHLKSSYRWQLWSFAVANVAIFWSTVVIQGGFFDIAAVFSNLSPRDGLFGALAPVVMLVMGGLISADNKARIIHWRYTNPLPGSFAFSRYLHEEPRADPKVLTEKWGELPTDPTEQNRLWYKIYKGVEEDIRIHETHRASLFSRDLTGYSVIFLVVFGLAAMFSTLSWSASGWYLGWLFLQYLVLMIAARTYGVRLVCNVLAYDSGHDT